MNRASLAGLLLAIAFLSPVHAEDTLTTFHYRDLYDIQQGVASLQDLRRLRVGLYITSTLPAVPRDSIKLVINRASGEHVDVPVDAAGRVELPASPDLQAENPLIVTNQPKHTLKASVVIDLVPLATTRMDYAGLMLGVRQFNAGIDRHGAMASLYASKSDGLLLFYNEAGHGLTLHGAKGDRMIKSEPVAAVKAHLKGIQTKYLIASTTVIYVPLDVKLLKDNPRVELDSLPADSVPAF